MKRSRSDATFTGGQKWHAVEVACTKDVCAAAAEIAGKRFLANEAPLLPLRECDRRNECACRYRHHDDRRRGPRRAAEGAPPGDRSVDRENRRASEGRREEDRMQWAEDDDEPTAGGLEDTYYQYVNRSKLGG